LNDALRTVELAAQKSPSSVLDDKIKELQRKLNAIQDRGGPIIADLTKDLDELRAKAKKADEDKAADAEKKKIADAITAKEKDIVLVTEIASEPSAKQHCRDDRDV